MNITIIGVGGVGGYFGGQLAKAGNNVTFIARGKNLEALRTNGLKVKSIKGDFHTDNILVTDNLTSLPKQDLIIIGVKSWQVKSVASSIKHLVHDELTVLPLQNGVLAFDELAEFIPKENIIGGLCKILSKIESPGVINHFGVNPTIVIGEMDNSNSLRIKSINEILSYARINTVIANDIDAEIWKKFISICVSGLLAICNSTYGEVLNTPETRKLMHKLMTEAYNVAIAKGVNLNDGLVDNIMSFLDKLDYNSNSSLTRDVLEGKPSEIEYQNGTVVKLANEFGVDVPVNNFIYSCIKPMENRARNK